MTPLWRSIRAAELPDIKDKSDQFAKHFVEESQLQLIDESRGFSPLRDQIQTPLLIVMGMVGLVVADGLRERLQPAARAGGRARQGNVGALRHGSRPLADRSAIADRRAAARTSRRSARIGDCADRRRRSWPARSQATRPPNCRSLRIPICAFCCSTSAWHSWSACCSASRPRCASCILTWSIRSSNSNTTGYRWAPALPAHLRLRCRSA